MKKYFLSIIIVFVISCAFLFADDYTIGKILQVSGGVSIIREEESFNCEVGDDVLSNDTIETKADSFVAINLSEGKGECVIKSNSKINLNTYKLGDNLNFTFSLSFGEIQTSLDEKSEEDYYNITTPTITSGVRGTKFTVYSNVLGESFVEVTDGVVEVGELDVGSLDNDSVSAIKNAISVREGERVKNILGRNNQILSASKSLDEWKNKAIDSGNIESVIPFYIVKLRMLSKGIYKIKNIQQKLTEIDKKIMNIFDNARKKVNNAKMKYGDLFSDKDYRKIMDKLNKKNKVVQVKLLSRKIKLAKYGFLLLNDYSATMNVLKELLNYIKQNSIQINIADIDGLKNQISKMKDKNTKVDHLEKDWRKYIYTQKSIKNKIKRK